MDRIQRAFFVSPFVGLASTEVILSVYARHWPTGIFTIAGTCIAYPIMLVLGIPAFMLLKRFHEIGFWSCLSISTICALIGWVALCALFSLPLGVHKQAGFFLAFATASGAASGVTFWSIAFQSRQT